MFQIDLTDKILFDRNDKMSFDKKVTFIYGKNGTGKTTLSHLIKEQCEKEYDVELFQGFDGVVDSDYKLNAVILGEENVTVSKKIAVLQEKTKKINDKIDELKKGIDSITVSSPQSLGAKQKRKKEECRSLERELGNFFSASAAEIKNKEPKIAKSTYQKNDYMRELAFAKELNEKDRETFSRMLLTEEKIALSIDIPNMRLKTLSKRTNDVLIRFVEEQRGIIGIDNNEKSNFAQAGLKIHKTGDRCAFCGNIIPPERIQELKTYFSKDEIKDLQGDINKEIESIDNIIDKINNITIDENSFYPLYRDEVMYLKKDFIICKQNILEYLTRLKDGLEDKKKDLFTTSNNSTIENMSQNDEANLYKILEKYNSIVTKNNNNSLKEKREDAKRKLRYDTIFKQINDFEYKNKKLQLQSKKNELYFINEDISKVKKQIQTLNSEKYTIINEMRDLEKSTKNERILAVHINKKLEHMVPFQLKYIPENGNNGYYRIHSLVTNTDRDVTELSTGEKNIVAFLYFLEKLNERAYELSEKKRIVVFDDPMNSNDDGMQYLIMNELEKLKKTARDNNQIVILTHNVHFYINMMYKNEYAKYGHYHLRKKNDRVSIIYIPKIEEDIKTSYDSLWEELKFLYNAENAPSYMLLNPIRRIIETYTKFNCENKYDFCSVESGYMKLLNVNSHSIDDHSADLCGLSKDEIIKMLQECFVEHNGQKHFESHWNS